MSGVLHIDLPVVDKVILKESEVPRPIGFVKSSPEARLSTAVKPLGKEALEVIPVSLKCNTF